MNNLRRALMFASVALTPFAANQVAKAQADAPSQVQLAATPPMGWNSWNKFACNVSEQLIRETADAIVSSGMKAAGYQHVNV
ncbi:MAG: alpha-galactosidase, partial [Acidobacteria bacterium]